MGEVVSPNRRYTCREFEKLTGRWFPQIVDRDSGNLYPIYIYNKNCGVSFWTWSREISGDRVALLLYIVAHIWKTGSYFFPLLYICLLCDEVLLPWNFRSPGFDIRAPQDPPNMKKKYIFSYFGFKLKNFLSDCFLIWHVHRYGWEDSWKAR